VSAKIPVNVITGFLGSGKTTLIRHLLADPALVDCAVIVNELGEIGLDHHLIERVEGEIVLLKSGCVCCTVRGDLASAIRRLYERRDDGSIRPFGRLLIETTGLADPVPVLSTIMHDPVIRHHFSLGAVITTIDAVNGEAQLDRQPESVKQAAVADRLVVTKTDLAAAELLARLEARLARLNPTASRFRSPPAAGLTDLLGGRDAFDPGAKPADVRHWFAAVEGLAKTPGLGLDFGCHDASIESLAMVFDRPVDWTVFGAWLTLLLAAHGDSVLRVKGLFNVVHAAGPVAVHAVQRLVHPPVHYDRWQDDDRRSRVVFIMRDLSPAAIRNSFFAFQNSLAPEMAEAPLPQI
jgi:G3E family GTPase